MAGATLGTPLMTIPSPGSNPVVSPTLISGAVAIGSRRLAVDRGTANVGRLKTRAPGDLVSAFISIREGGGGTGGGAGAANTERNDILGNTCVESNGINNKTPNTSTCPNNESASA
jgi:hypothetical protein